MTRPSSHRWPEPIDLDDDAGRAAARPDVAFAAAAAAVRGVCPALTDDYLLCGPRAGTATTDWMRQCCMYLLAGRLAISLTECGRLFKRDRTSIRHGVHVVVAAAEASASTAQFLDYLEGQLVGELRRMTYDGEI